MRTRTFILLSIIACILQTSCKKKVDKYINVTGTVLNEQTNIPISGLNISLSQAIGSIGSAGGWIIIATKTTDANGNYSFYIKVDDASDCKVDINSKPYNLKYSTYWFSVYTDKQYTLTTYLYRYATLTVSATTSNPLGPNDAFYLYVSGIGCSCDYLTTTTAKGGAFNIVKWTVIRNNMTNNFKDSVFCPVDTTTFYNINY